MAKNKSNKKIKKGKNKYIKMMDKLNIKDGLLREFLLKGNVQAAMSQGFALSCKLQEQRVAIDNMVSELHQTKVDGEDWEDIVEIK